MAENEPGDAKKEASKLPAVVELRETRDAIRMEESGGGREKLAPLGRASQLPEHLPQSFPNLDFHHAYMLATLPRKRADDPISTPLACTLTAAVPAIVSLLEAIQWTWPPDFSLGLVGLVEIAIFLGCATWYGVTKSSEGLPMTSLEYLEKLRTGDKSLLATSTPEEKHSSEKQRE
jgi:hypothetical protein